MSLVRSPRRSALILTVLTVFVLPGTVAHAENPAAHALADKFAEADKAAAEKARKKEQDAKNRAAAEARHKAEEAEMLERARREAAERDEALRRAEAALKEAQRIVREAEALRRAEEEERQVEEARRKDEARRAKEAARAEAERRARVAEERAEEKRLNALAAQREEEARRLSEKLKRIQQTRPPVGMALGGDPQSGNEAAATQTVPPDPSTPAMTKPTKLTSKVTVLLVMEPGTNGIRRGNKTADPVLCLRSGCYVSRGPSRAAKWMPRRKALGPVNTISRRAGACRRSLVCVFRNVDLSKGTVVQPIDLRYVRHDRREPTKISADPTCDLISNRLTCAQRTTARGWHAWIVPEPLAEDAGPRALKKALTKLSKPVIGAAYRASLER